ncbi:SLC13 family permease [Cerasicoccus frondis]|uniref:SLC13 family permease n=1 Tax=Cerasicoccus frondis TaxID=490090 RepID=UPI0028524F0B|nr:SLC13 family permease [Cerasicoccus frondis]
MTPIVVIFALVYVGLALGTAPYLKIDRTGIAMLGAIVIVAGGWLPEQTAWDSVNTETMSILLGMMILSAHLKLSGGYQLMTKKIAKADLKPPAMLAAIIGLSGLFAAFLTNDVVAMAIAPVLISICHNRNLDPIPYLLGLCCSVNAGSALLLIGSPSSMLVGQTLDLKFLPFMFSMIIPTVFSCFSIWAVLAWCYRGKWRVEEQRGQYKEPDIEQNWVGIWIGLFVLAALVCVYSFTDLPRDLVALGVAGFFFVHTRITTRRLLQEVNWQLIMLFFALFVVNAAFNSTGLPTKAVDWMSARGVDLHDSLWLFASTAVISDMFSNLPAVMLLLPYAEGHRDGVAMILGCTMSSNLVIFGSLANIVVVDTAAQHGIKISLWRHSSIGLPITILSMGFAFLWLWLM